MQSQLMLQISDMIIPALVFYIIAMGLASKRDIYHCFIKGASSGIKTVAEIAPTLIGLMVAVGVLRASGFLDFVSVCLKKLLAFINLPADLFPIAIVKMFSSSAATGLLLDLFRQYGPDSRIGMAASVIMSSTETVFYCLSIYFGSVKVRRTRYAVPGALIATAAGIVASIWITGK